jgi:hypothetical protein
MRLVWLPTSKNLLAIGSNMSTPHIDKGAPIVLREWSLLAVENNVECEPALGILPNKKIGQKVARFREINAERPCAHHDALEFPDGQVILVTRAGQHATVLPLHTS